MTIIGISRCGLFSPGRTESDSAIFNKVKENIEEQGYDVVHIPEQLLDPAVLNGEIHIDAVFQMARSNNALKVLDSLSTEIPVVNSVQAIRNCNRMEQTQLLMNTGFIPESLCCKVSDGVPAVWDSYPCWVKRGDTHSVEKQDVSFAQNADQVAELLSDMHKRGIEQCVLQVHISGRLLKFYGVSGKGIADSFFVEESDKFGSNLLDNNISITTYDHKLLECIAERAARILGTEVYGGDIIVTENGDMFLIDFNDWPSFGSCCNRAAAMICELILDKIKL